MPRLENTQHDAWDFLMQIGSALADKSAEGGWHRIAFLGKQDYLMPVLG